MTRHSRLAAGVFIIGLGVTACSRGTDSPAAAAAAPVPVTVAAVTMEDVADTFESGGVVQAWATATLMSRILAPVRDVRAVPGDRVRAGQVLIILDDRDLAAESRRARAARVSADQDVLAARSERQAADATLALARVTHERMAVLHARRSASAQELDDATGALRVAEGRAAGAAAREQATVSGVDVARAANEAAETIVSFARIAAPFDGVVADKTTEPGNMAAPGTALMRVEDTRRFRLDVRVDASRIRDVSIGAAVPVSVDSGAHGEPVVLNGTVTEIAGAVDPDTRAFLVKIALPAATGLRSGMFGRARFSDAPRRGLTVPPGAIVRRGQVTSVFVVDRNIARLRLVNVRETEVLAGLAEGDLVIVNAPPAVVDGRRVAPGGR